MDFRKFIGENSGKSNPIVNLASHATQDYALQDQIGIPSTPSQLENEFPQTFRMNELMHQLENPEVESNTFLPVPSNSMNMPAANWTNARTHQEAIWAETNVMMQQQQFYPQYGISTQEMFYPNNQMNFSNSQEYPYHSYPSQTHNHYYQYNEKEVEETRQRHKEFAAIFEAKLKEGQTNYSMDNIEKPNGNKNKSTTVNEEAKIKKKVFYFDGLKVEEAFHAPSPDIEWSKAENFYFFVTNHKRKVMNFDLQIEKKFKFNENNLYIDIDDPLSQGMQYSREGDYCQAILCYEAAVQKDEHCLKGWQQLIHCLRNDGRNLEAFYLIKQSLPLDPDYFSKVLYSILISEQYYYQGCQIILDWLEQNPKYCNLVPPNFTLEDKTSNMIEKEQLKTLQDILIKAAQLTPYNPNYYVQSALSLLLEISRDYSKANDCRLYLSHADPELWKQCELGVGINLLRNNEPLQAISYFNKLKKSTSKSTSTALFKSHCEHGLALTCMFLKSYKNAGKCLLAGLRISKMTNNVLWLHLLLCAQLMRRNDLINLVNNGDFHQLCKEFDYLPNPTSVLGRIRKRQKTSKRNRKFFLNKI